MKLSLKILLLTLLALPLFAQNQRSGLSVGMGGGGTIGATTELSSELRFHGRAFLRYGFSDFTQLELGGGIGRISGSEYSALAVPIDARLLVIPVSFEQWYPFVYGGGGLLHYVADLEPFTATTNKNSNGWTSVIPFGAGVSFVMTDRVNFEISGGYSLTGTDEIDVTETNSTNDNYWSFLLSLTTSLETGSLDDDGDGLTNEQEESLGTNPKVADTDGDGLNDGDEFMRHNTDPKKADSDGDGLSDFDELKTYSTDPNKADTDGDGLNDGDELLKHKTEPTKADTDNDGLSDGDEILKHKTDAMKFDSDGDGLSDGAEISKHKTNALAPDTDLGTVNDGTEVGRGTNPLDASDDLPKKETVKMEMGESIVLEGITFKTASAEISPESEQVLEKVYNTLAENTSIEIQINGHTDNVGSRSSNMKLSNDRAESVKTYLVNKGINGARIQTKGFGPDKPIAKNTTDEGKQKNRRIEFIRTK